MRIKDVFTIKAQFEGNETIDIRVLLEYGPDTKDSYLLCSICKFHNKLFEERKSLINEEHEVRFSFNIGKQQNAMSGYGVEVELYESGERKQCFSSAFDILDSWKYAPRYGFLSDFDDGDMDDEDIKSMNKYHINVVQFYDWMFRHHQLFPAESKFTDPMGRSLNMDAVKCKLDAAHKHGMKAFAYGAVYASGRDFYEEHKDWGLYTNDNKPEMLSDFLYIMDIHPSSGWNRHIKNEYLEAVKYGFDGIHMDQYGFPKYSISKTRGKETLRRLDEDFPALIEGTKLFIGENGYEAGLIFNAVNNWPVETVAKSCEDAVYIEVWPPNDTYQDLYNLISNAKKYAENKQVILSAYMKPFSLPGVPETHKENAALITMAVIFVSGGFHLLLGEKDGVLTEAYYPAYATVEHEEYKLRLRSYYDFIVKYEELLYDFDIKDHTMAYTGGINDEYVFEGAKFSPKAEPGCVWTLVKEKPGYKIVDLVNFNGIDGMNWNETKENAPEPVVDIEITALITERVKGVYMASPDMEWGKAEKLDFEYVPHPHGKAVKFTVPNLKYWDLIYIVCNPEDTL